MLGGVHPEPSYWQRPVWIYFFRAGIGSQGVPQVPLSYTRRGRAFATMV